MNRMTKICLPENWDHQATAKSSEETYFIFKNQDTDPASEKQ